MKFSSKQILIVAGVILVIFIIIGIWFYRKGKKQTTIAQVPLDTPGNPSAANNPSGVSNSSIIELADELHREMDGLNVWRDPSPYVKLINLSDTDFVKTYNAFNIEFQSEGEGTLKEWIESESGLGEFATLKDSILQRMGRLNLK